jgi:hypothetical protein
VPAKAPAKATNVAAALKPPAAAAPALKLSKDELRVRVEQLERTNATLRAKNREANRTAKTATAWITELEEMSPGLLKQVASQTPSTKEEQAAKTSRAKRKSPGVDRGHSGPAGVAANDPAFLRRG